MWACAAATGGAQLHCLLLGCGMSCWQPEEGTVDPTLRPTPILSRYGIEDMAACLFGRGVVLRCPLGGEWGCGLYGVRVGWGAFVCQRACECAAVCVWGFGVACVSLGCCGSYFRILPYPFPSAEFWAGVCRLDWWAGSIPSRSLHVPLVLSVGEARGALGSIKGLGHHFR
jgi:hypothetical protein